MMENNNILKFGEQNTKKQKIRATSDLRKPIKAKTEICSYSLVGNHLEPFGVRDGDFIIAQLDADDIRDSDLAIIEYHGQPVVFKVYFDGDKVILHGEKVEILERSKVKFVGRVIRLERDF